MQGVTENDFKKRNISLISKVDESAPATIRASHLMFRQVILNLLSTTVAGSVRTTVEIMASGQESGDQKNLSVEIKNNRNEYSKEQCLQIEELCLEEELVRILEAGQSCDVNLIIALILSRQLGWPIDFINEDSSCSFVLVVPASPFGVAVPAASTMDGLMAKQSTP